MVIVVSIMLANVVYAADTVVYTPKNMLNVRVTDEEGNAIVGAEVELYNSSGDKVFSWTSNDSNVYSVTQGNITTDPAVSVDVSELSQYTDGEAIFVKETDSFIWYKYWTCDGNEKNLEVRYEYTPEIVEGSNYTVAANTLVTVVDESYENRTKTAGISLDEASFYSFNGKSGIITYELSAGEYSGSTFLGGGGGHMPTITTSDEAKEYVKIKMKLTDVSSDFSNDGSFVAYGETFNVGTEGQLTGMLAFFSGAMVTVTVPDEDGYVEIYVDKETLSYNFITRYISEATNIGGMGLSGSESYEKKCEITIAGVNKPGTGINIYNIPAGEYTMKVASAPDGYAIPETQTFNITNSDEFNYKTIVLGEAHTHSYGTEYKKDETNHWYECACGDKSGVETHVSSGAATETEAEVCTKCGYVIEEALVHTHSYGTEYKKDETNHWYECACGDKNGVEAHVSSGAATETEAEVCTKCGYVIEEALVHTHSYGTEYKKDETNHWYECACGDKSGVEAHKYEWVIDKKASVGIAGSKHEECTNCGYKKKTVEIPALEEEIPQTVVIPNVEDDSPNTGDNTHIEKTLLTLLVSLIVFLVAFDKKRIVSNK